MQIMLALLVSAAIAVIAFLLGAAGWTCAAILAAGGIATAIVASKREPQGMSPPIITEADFSAEDKVLNAISEPAMLVVEGRVRVANSAACGLLGSHIVGEDVRLAIRYPAAAERLTSTAGDGVVELVGVGGRDQRYDMNVNTIAPGRRIIHLIDRTGRHAVEKARVDFVANASHELRTPLAALLGFIETLTDENAGGDPVVRARFLDVMLKEARRMQRLIDDLISLSRIEAEKFELPEARVSLASVIDQVAGEVRDTAGERQTAVVLSLDRTVPEIIGERAQLSQVLHNLIGNAIKYGRADASVTVTLAQEGTMLRLSVTDRGDGIPAQHLPRLTERFYRVDPGRSRSLGGTGLGLAIVKHIVERHRGRLEISSIVGTGTTVCVILPVPPVTQTSPN